MEEGRGFAWGLSAEAVCVCAVWGRWGSEGCVFLCEWVGIYFGAISTVVVVVVGWLKDEL